MVTDSLKCFTEKGLTTKIGDKDATKDYEFDIIIYATGFNVLDSFRAYETRGKDKSKTLQEHVGDEPRAYKGTTMVQCFLRLL